jgi:transaldolase
VSSYLSWVIENTPTQWWHDSAEESELETGLARGAIGVTTNPVLASAALVRNRPQWREAIDGVLAQKLPAEEQAEALVQIAVTRAAARLLPRYEASEGRSGFVCAQVNPARATDRRRMCEMARRIQRWAPNLSVKLPATAAGLDVLEDLVADGISTTATVSFTVPQVIAVAERHKAGAARARARGIEPGRCFAVIMIGRLDDYLREVASDLRADVSEADICQAGLAVAKRAYEIYRSRGYDAVLLVAALRGDYHLTELAGAELLMSIHPAYQQGFVSKDLPREPRIDRAVPADVIARLQRLPDFIRAYEPQGMTAAEFVSFGLTQRTLGQFIESWKFMENYR